MVMGDIVVPACSLGLMVLGLRILDPGASYPNMIIGLALIVTSNDIFMQWMRFRER